MIAPGLVSLNYASTSGNSSYHALQVTAEKRFGTGLGFLTAYTYSHAIDNVPLQQGGNGDGPVPQDPRYRFLDRGNSSFDIRHRWTQTVLYNLPFGKGKKFSSSHNWVNTAFGDWQVNMILILQTGLPFTPSLASPVANTGTGSRPDRLGDAALPNPDPARWFNTALGTPGAPWGTPAIYTFGNAAEASCTVPAAPTSMFPCSRNSPSRSGSGCSSAPNFSTCPTTRSSTCRTPVSEHLSRERFRGRWGHRAISSSGCALFSK